jgi:hypothetical protein
MRVYYFGSLMLLFSLWGQDGVNYPGGDYSNFNAESVAVCKNSCGGQPRCQAWTWVKPGIQGPSGHCWLKSKVPASVPDRCCWSGEHTQTLQSEMKPEDRTNRPGSDFKDFVTRPWEMCQSACLRDDKCGAWTYVRPTSHCFLKTGVPNPGPDPNMISGVKVRGRTGTFD